MLERLQDFTAPEGVVFIGRAQEKTRCSAPRSGAARTGDSYPWIVKTTGVINQFYFYCVDADFGPFFLKFCSYFPYTAKLCLLTELPGGGPLVMGRMRVRVVMVPACDRKHRTGTGFERVGGSCGWVLCGTPGIRSSRYRLLDGDRPGGRPGRGVFAGPCRRGGCRRRRSGPTGWRCCAGSGSWARSGCRGSRRLGSRPAISAGGSGSRTSRCGRIGGIGTTRSAAVRARAGGGGVGEPGDREGATRNGVRAGHGRAQRDGAARFLRVPPGRRVGADGEPVPAGGEPCGPGERASQSDGAVRRRARVAGIGLGWCRGCRGRSPTEGSTSCSPRSARTVTGRWWLSGCRPVRGRRSCWVCAAGTPTRASS